MRLLRILIVILLFSILGMQVAFLMTKKIDKPGQSTTSVVNDSIPEADSTDLEAMSFPKAVKPSPPTTRQGRKSTVNQSSAIYVVDASKCIGCNLCIPNCPVSAITSHNGVAVIDKNKCIGCGICKDGDDKEFVGCPVSAIDKK